MAQFSIGICTPIPMLPVDEGKILKNKVADAALRLEGGDQTGCLQALRESLAPSAGTEKHLGLITPEWQRARTNLVTPPGHAAVEIFADGMEVGVARCSAVNAARQNGLKYLFFIDWDNLVPSDALLKLAYWLDNNPDYDIASGLYCMKSIPPYPLLWRDWNQGVDFDWTMGQRIECGVVGIPMGCCLLRLSLFDKLPATEANPWFKTVDTPVFCGGAWGRMRMTEDLWFTKRYTDEVDIEHCKIMVDTSVWLEHICHTTGKRYTLGSDTLPMKRAMQAGTVPLNLPTEKKKVLHVGCGTAKLPEKFKDYSEVRLDIDPAVKPDVVGSITSIPLHSEGFDDLYSSHNLEHLQAAEVEIALQEFRRLLKPGGKVWIDVPDVAAVAKAIPSVGLDGVLYQAPCGPITAADVLYGYHVSIAAGNNFMAHRTGFTQQTLHKALADAGFGSIDVRSAESEYALYAQAVKG